MKNVVFAVSAAFALLPVAHSVAYADDDGARCQMGSGTMQEMEMQLRKQLTDQGWDVRSIDREDGCLEVYALDADGKRVEAYFDPATMQRVRTHGEEKKDD